MLLVLKGKLVAAPSGTVQALVVPARGRPQPGLLPWQNKSEMARRAARALPGLLRPPGLEPPHRLLPGSAAALLRPPAAGLRPGSAGLAVDEVV